MSLSLYYGLHLLVLWWHRGFISSAGSQRTNTQISTKIMFSVMWSNHLCEMSFNRVLIMLSISTGQSFTYLNSKPKERERQTHTVNRPPAAVKEGTINSLTKTSFFWVFHCCINWLHYIDGFLFITIVPVQKYHKAQMKSHFRHKARRVPVRGLYCEAEKLYVLSLSEQHA